MSQKRRNVRTSRGFGDTSLTALHWELHEKKLHEYETAKTEVPHLGFQPRLVAKFLAAVVCEILRVKRFSKKFSRSSQCNAVGPPATPPGLIASGALAALGS